MAMNTIRNIQFTLLICINKQLHEFNFRQRNPDLYDTDTADERSNRYFFKMIKENQVWKIEGKDLPAWISSSESLIQQALTDQEKTLPQSSL